MKLLLINGNRTQAVTDIVLTEARLGAAPGTQVSAVTAAFGADIVFSHAGDVIAAYAVLDTLARHHTEFDAFILAISFDSGLAAARELVRKPVFGITESAIKAAQTGGKRLGILTVGQVSSKLYADVFARYGLAPGQALWRTIDIASSNDYLAAQERDAHIVSEIGQLAAEGAEGVVICGAALSGTARRLHDQVQVPLFDGVSCAVAQAESMVHNTDLSPATSIRSRLAGVPAEMVALFDHI